MSEEKELEQFKQEFIAEYVDSSLDRLLDLRNKLRDATSFEEIHGLMGKEQEFLSTRFGVVPIPVRGEKNATKTEKKSNTDKD